MNVLIENVGVNRAPAWIRQPGFKISEISADISAIFRVSVNTDTIYPLDNRPTEISKFFGSYRRYFADISVFYRFFAIFPDISVLFMEPVLFMNSTISGHCS